MLVDTRLAVYIYFYQFSMIILEFYIVYMFAKIDLKESHFNNERYQAIAEITEMIKTIKCNRWEKLYSKRVKDLRT